VKVSAREKKILYAGIVIVAVLLVYHVATMFLPDDGSSLSEKLETQENLIRRQREFIGREDLYKKRIEDAESDIERIQAWLLPGNNAVAANAELLRILTDFAEQTGVIITQKSNLPERKVADSDSMIKVSARIAIDCIDANNCRIEEDMVDFLTAIKNYDKFLKIEEISIGTSIQQKQRRIRRPLSMTVAGYISVPPPPETEAKPGENPVQATASTARETMKR